MFTFPNRTLATIPWLAIIIIALSGCSGGDDGVEITELSEEDLQAVPATATTTPESEALPEGHPPLTGTGAMPDGMMDMANATLPESAVGQGNLPTWSLPTGWSADEPGPMRRATLLIDDGPLAVAVTSFPGDVGGLAANVNRWRRQLGLPPVPEERLPDFVSEMTVAGKGVLLVDLLGPPSGSSVPTQRTLTAVMMHQGESWFFKMSGDAPAIERHRPAFLDFVQSLRFPTPDAAPDTP